MSEDGKGWRSEVSGARYVGVIYARKISVVALSKPHFPTISGIMIRMQRQ